MLLYIIISPFGIFGSNCLVVFIILDLNLLPIDSWAGDASATIGVSVIQQA